MLRVDLFLYFLVVSFSSLVKMKNNKRKETIKYSYH